MGEKLFFSGKNVQQALLAASRKLALLPEEIAYTDRTKIQGGLKGSRSVIEVDAERPRRSGVPVAAPGVLKRPAETVVPTRQAAALPASRIASGAAGRAERGTATETRPPRRRPPAEPAPDVAPELIVEAAETAARMLMAVAGVRAQPAARFAAGVVEVDLSSAGTPVGALSREALFAVQHLVPRTLRGLIGVSLPCRVDIAGQRRVHEERLQAEALRAAKAAIEQGRAVTLAPMDAADRRVVHMALRDTPGVRTESEGDGEARAVVIRPA